MATESLTRDAYRETRHASVRKLTPYTNGSDHNTRVYELSEPFQPKPTHVRRLEGLYEPDPTNVHVYASKLGVRKTPEFVNVPRKPRASASVGGARLLPSQS